ncbi:MAG: DNA alkylation repair protein [Parabacteroides sp.]|nr:DNA alkylation repair protein [Parabacteroides sp.]MBP9480439.1 DNA alkylation repair protein [Parabacteroides sp.]
MKNSILEQVRLELKNSVDEKTLDTAQHFFKEQITAYGVKVPVVNKISSAFLSEIKSKSKQEVFDLCEELWRSGMLEESFIACSWSYAICKKFEPSDFEVFERWVQNYVDNWASCDTLCNHTVGEFIEMYPQFLSKLKEWATSENRWMRRAAAVTLIIPARKGLFLNDIFEIAELLLADKDDLVQKGYGWMLKAASQAYQTEVLDFVIKYKTTMPRTALRYAIEKMPQEMKAQAMKR